MMPVPLAGGFGLRVNSVGGNKFWNENGWAGTAQNLPPQIVIHRELKTFIEAAYCFPCLAPNQRRWLRDQAPLRQVPFRKFSCPSRAWWVFHIHPYSMFFHRQTVHPDETGGRTTSFQPILKIGVVRVQPTYKRRCSMRYRFVDRCGLPVILDCYATKRVYLAIFR